MYKFPDVSIGPHCIVTELPMYYLLRFSSDFSHNISFIPVDFKKILDDFRQNLDSSGEIGKVSFYSLFIIYALAIVVGLCGNILIVTTVLGRKRHSEPELKILFKNFSWSKNKPNFQFFTSLDICYKLLKKKVSEIDSHYQKNNEILEWDPTFFTN